MKISPATAGTAGFVSILLVYFGTLSILNSPAHALEQFRGDWWWVLVFAAGMGIQLWLHAKIHSNARVAGVSAGSSAAAMVACCVHHIADFTPLAGIAFLGSFFESYQPLFIIVGLLANLVGISYAMSAGKRFGKGIPFVNAIDWGIAWKIEVAVGIGALAGWLASG